MVFFVGLHGEVPTLSSKCSIRTFVNFPVFLSQICAGQRWIQTFHIQIFSVFVSFRGYAFSVAKSSENATDLHWDCVLTTALKILDKLVESLLKSSIVIKQ